MLRGVENQVAKHPAKCIRVCLYAPRLVGQIKGGFQAGCFELRIQRGKRLTERRPDCNRPAGQRRSLAGIEPGVQEQFVQQGFQVRQPPGDDGQVLLAAHRVLLTTQ